MIDRVFEPPLASLGTGDLVLGGMTLATGNIHWLQVAQADDATRLLRQTLIGLSLARATLVSTRERQDAVLNGLQPDQGPHRLDLLTVSPPHMAALLRVLPSELDRAIHGTTQLVILALSGDAFAQPPSSNWIAKVHDWLVRRSTALLIVSEGHSTAIASQLQQRISGLSGYAAIAREAGTPRLLVYYWHSRPAAGPREILLSEEAEGFRTRQLLPSSSAQAEAAPDRHEVHAERAALSGLRAEPFGWRVYADRAELLPRVATAQQASVLLGISRSDEVDELAVQLDRLRRSSGDKLKLIVREASPCLRYRDDQLLMAAGASLVMPFGTPLSRMLTLIEGIQGHTWQRQSPNDIADSLGRSKPLPLRGRLTPRAFAEAVRHMWAAKRHGELDHSLLHIRLLPGLSPDSLLGESRFRRQGDILCQTEDGLYLFLFACRSETVEAALDNIFPVSWQELFVSFERLNDLSDLDRTVFLADEAPSTGVADRPSADTPGATLAPRSVRLELSTEARP